MTCIANLTVAAQQICPACDYSLAGLPDEHRCPECGFAYRGDMIVWRRSGSRGAWKIAGLVLMYLALFAIFYARMGAVPAAIICAALGGLIGEWSRRRQACGRLVIGPEQLQFLRPASSSLVYSVNEIGHAKSSIMNGAIILISCDGKVLAKLPRDLVGSTRRTKLLVAAINKKVAKHRVNRPG